uniref:Uncharacterized protein n=1 Tax=Nelumbo nucifera TaxID=4432 RepID=A0A822Z397_NELNU|nr:TPA_asm: hypothetical protein HUJ06_008576 [Nelumbo nucifera]
MKLIKGNEMSSVWHIDATIFPNPNLGLMKEMGDETQVDFLLPCSLSFGFRVLK